MAPATLTGGTISKSKKEKTLAMLRELGGTLITEESGIAHHPGKQILLPEGMSLKTAAKLVTSQAQAMEEEHAFKKMFKYRPWDGAYNFQEALKEVFGVGGIGRPIHSFFGSTPPEYRTVEIGIDQEVEVPWGRIEFPPLEAIIQTGAEQDPTYGWLFSVTVLAPKKYGPEIRGLFKFVEDRLKNQSIYKGKAIVGTGRLTREGYENPAFLDLDTFEPERIVFREEVGRDLENYVLGVIRNAALLRKARQPVAQKNLMFGPYGSGKTSAGFIAALEAVKNGWTFIQTKVGDEDPAKVLKTAELYAPCLVFIEDVDGLMSPDSDEMAKLLEMFDGLGAKGKEVSVLMTSNRVDDIAKGMMRAGRIDHIIEIGDLDRPGVEKLIKVEFTPDQLAEDIDFERIHIAMEGYEPSFIKGTFNTTHSNAIIRTESLQYTLSTEDFVAAAESYRNQHDRHLAAKEKPEEETLGKVLRGIVVKATDTSLESHEVDMDDGEIMSKAQ